MTPLRARQFRGAGEGPHLLVTAGVHGDETTPMAAVRRLIERFDSGEAETALSRGTLTLVPVVNEAAYRAGARCAREDGLDLARVCPGRPRGTVTERAAHHLSAMIREADLFVDLHSGGSHYRIDPLAGYMLVPDEAVLAEQRTLARDFGLPLIWGTSAALEGRSLSVARDAKVPAIYVEYLGTTALCDAGIEACVRGVLRILAAREMLVDGAPWRAALDSALVVEDPRPQSGHLQVCHPAPCDGFFEARVELGEPVEAGARLGEVMDLCGAGRCEIQAEISGRVIMLRSTPQVRAGESLGVVMEDPSRETSAASAASAAPAIPPARPAGARGANRETRGKGP